MVLLLQISLSLSQISLLEQNHHNFISFYLLSATIFIEAHWILSFQVTIFLKCLSIIYFMYSLLCLIF
jgi:hypothetical protein